MGGSIAIMASELEQMVRHHIPQRAGTLVKLAALLDADGLRNGDLNMIDVIAPPQRLEDAVREAQDHNVLDRFFAEEMIDPVDLVFGKNLQNSLVQLLGRGEIVPEGLLDDDPPPCAFRLLGEPGAAELLDDLAEKAVGGGEIE